MAHSPNVYRKYSQSSLADLYNSAFLKSLTHIVNVPHTQNPAQRRKRSPPQTFYLLVSSATIKLSFSFSFFHQHQTINTQVAGFLGPFVDNWKNTVVSFSLNMQFHGNPGIRDQFLVQIVCWAKNVRGERKKQQVATSCHEIPRTHNSCQLTQQLTLWYVEDSTSAGGQLWSNQQLRYLFCPFGI